MGYEDNNRQIALAIKLLINKDDSTSIYDNCKSEIEIMDKLDHPNVIKQYAYGEALYKKQGKEDLKKFYIALEIAKGGELFDYIAHTGPLSEPMCRYYFK